MEKRGQEELVWRMKGGDKVVGTKIRSLIYTPKPTPFKYLSHKIESLSMSITNSNQIRISLKIVGLIPIKIGIQTNQEMRWCLISILPHMCPREAMRFFITPSFF